MLHALVAIALAAAAAPPDGPVAPGRPRVALLPLESLAPVSAARGAVGEALAAALERQGVEVVRGAPVEAFLEARRIRYLDSLPAAQVAALLDATGAEAALMGTVLAWRREAQAPAVAVALRLVGRDGATRWGAVRSLASGETVRAFGRGRLGTTEALAGRLAEGLAAELPVGPGPRGGAARPGAGGGRVLAWRDPALAHEPLLVCPLPVQNLSGDREAPRVLEAVLQQRLAMLPGVAVVPPADLRAALVRLGYRAPSQLSPEQLRAVGDVLGTPYFVQGTLLAYGQGQTDAGDPTPEVELHLQLLDAARGRLAWSGEARRLGTDAEGLFRQGLLLDPIPVSSRLVAELLEAFRR